MTKLKDWALGILGTAVIFLVFNLVHDEPEPEPKPEPKIWDVEITDSSNIGLKEQGIEVDGVIKVRIDKMERI